MLIISDLTGFYFDWSRSLRFVSGNHLAREEPGACGPVLWQKERYWLEDSSGYPQFCGRGYLDCE